MSSTATTTEPSCSSPLSPVLNANEVCASDDENDDSALSKRWRFERKSRTWSRIEEEFTQELQSAGIFGTSDTTTTTTASSSLSPQHARRRVPTAQGLSFYENTNLRNIQHHPTRTR